MHSNTSASLRTLRNSNFVLYTIWPTFKFNASCTHYNFVNTSVCTLARTNKNMHTSMYIHAHIHANAHTQANTCTHTYARARIYTHTHTHSHIFARTMDVCVTQTRPIE